MVYYIALASTFNVAEAQWKLPIYEQGTVPRGDGHACTDGHSNPSLQRVNAQQSRCFAKVATEGFAFSFLLEFNLESSKEQHEIAGNAMSMRAVMPAICALLSAIAPRKVSRVLAGN